MVPKSQKGKTYLDKETVAVVCDEVNACALPAAARSASIHGGTVSGGGASDGGIVSGGGASDGGIVSGGGAFGGGIDLRPSGNATFGIIANANHAALAYYAGLFGNVGFTTDESYSASKGNISISGAGFFPDANAGSSADTLRELTSGTFAINVTATAASSGTGSAASANDPMVQLSFRFFECTRENPCRCCLEECECLDFSGNFVPSNEPLVRLPQLNDQIAARKMIYRAEQDNLLGLSAINDLVLFAADTGREATFTYLLKNVVTEFDKKVNPRNKRQWPKRRIGGNSFWFALKTVNKLYRQHQSQVEGMILAIRQEYDVDAWKTTTLEDEASNLRVYYEQELKLYYIVLQIFEIESSVPNEISHAAYKQAHLSLVEAIKALNRVESDFSGLRLGAKYKSYFIDDFRLSKKRLYKKMLKLDAENEKLAAKHSARTRRQQAKKK